ncbi:MAG: sugar ABC transporter permease [Clostridia bacterium]|nr:sugar ABC transporter permease [Clostridia bacterium]
MGNVKVFFAKNFERAKTAMRSNMRQYAMLIALIAIMIIFQILTKGILLKPRNVSKLIYQNSYILILAIGMVLLIISGGNIDLSVGALVAFVSALSALFSVKMGLPPAIAIVLGLVFGTLAGMWQGFWIAYVKIPSFIVTLAGMLVFRGLNNLILEGETIALPDLYVKIASSVVPDFIGGADSGLHLTTIIIGVLFSIVYTVVMILSRSKKKRNNFEISPFYLFVLKTASIVAIINLFMYWLSRDDGLPIVLIILAVLIGIYSFITIKTVAGRHIYALGGNQKAAALSGVKTKRVLFWVYANMGLMAAVAGIVFAGRLNAASPTAGMGFELDAIAACFIGGASAAGGVGTVIGAIIGAFIMGILNNGMSIMGLSIFWQDIIKGLVLLTAVAFDVYSKSKAKKAA